MATYKVLQDIEAEDTLVGPLTLRQCIYAAIAALSGYLCFICISRHAPLLTLPLLPFVGLGVFFAFPWSKQQPTEVWALAKVRFMLKPRKRIWNQSGVRQLVTITAPKNVRLKRGDTLSPNEVKSRLKALADTIDSRGWAIKNVDLGYYRQSPLLVSGQADSGSDRLIGMTYLPPSEAMPDASASADIFDIRNNPVAQKFDAMMSQAAGTHRQQLMQQLSQPVPAPAPAAAAPSPASYWHLRTIQPLSGNPGQTAGAAVAPVVPPQSAATGATAAPDTALSPVSPPAAGSAAAAPAPASQAAPPVTAVPNPAILDLANNNDLNVATIAREAQARNGGPTDEVVVSLR